MQRGTRAQFSRRVRHQDDVFIYSESTTRESYGPNYTLTLETSLAGRVPHGRKAARTWYPIHYCDLVQQNGICTMVLTDPRLLETREPHPLKQNSQLSEISV